MHLKTYGGQFYEKDNHEMENDFGTMKHLNSIYAKLVDIFPLNCFIEHSDKKKTVSENYST